jgi:hypothetical protein
MNVIAGRRLGPKGGKGKGEQEDWRNSQISRTFVPGLALRDEKLSESGLSPENPCDTLARE